MTKGTFQAEAMSKSEKKSSLYIALAIVNLCWSEGISQSVSQSVGWSVGRLANRLPSQPVSQSVRRKLH